MLGKVSEWFFFFLYVPFIVHCWSACWKRQKTTIYDLIKLQTQTYYNADRWAYAEEFYTTESSLDLSAACCFLWTAGPKKILHHLLSLTGINGDLSHWHQHRGSTLFNSVPHGLIGFPLLLSTRSGGWWRHNQMCPRITMLCPSAKFTSSLLK